MSDFIHKTLDLFPIAVRLNSQFLKKADGVLHIYQIIPLFLFGCGTSLPILPFALKPSPASSLSRKARDLLPLGPGTGDSVRLFLGQILLFLPLHFFQESFLGPLKLS